MSSLGEVEVTGVLDRQTQLMEQLASGGELGPVLGSIVEALEELMPGSRSSVLLLDDTGRLRHGAAPSLPVAYSAAIDGLEPGPSAGSCGTAVHIGGPVVASDVTTDPRWVSFRELAAEHDLRACWSSPIHCRDEIVGTFAVYHSHPYEPGERDQELVRRFTHLASIAVDFDRARVERRARDEAELARHSAERANVAKSQFVTALSHELRTPLQAIRGFTENLRTLELSPEQRRDALELIDGATSHILSIVDDVLDLARVEAGAMPMTTDVVEVSTVVDEAVALIAPIAARKGVPIEVESTDLTAIADLRRLRQVLLNLIANSVRFSRDGSPVRVRAEPVADGCRIDVVDRGPGIPADLLSRLFVPFDRLGADAGREGGAGLGLVLARRLTEAMGGRLELESTVGHGTTASVHLCS